MAAVLVRPRAAVSKGAQEGPGLREKVEIPFPPLQLNRQRSSLPGTQGAVLGVGRSVQGWMASYLYWPTPWLPAFVNLRLTVLSLTRTIVSKSGLCAGGTRTRSLQF